MVALVWGFNMPIMKFGIGEMNEYLYNALRLSFSALVLALIVLWQRSPLIQRDSKTVSIGKQWLGIVTFSFLAGFAYQVLFLMGIAATSAGNTALILSTLPMWSAILAWLILREKLHRWGWLGLLVTLTGTIIVASTKGSIGTSQNTLHGNILVAAAAFSWAFVSVISRPIMKTASPIALAFVSAVMFLPLHFLISWNSIGDLKILIEKPLVLASVAYSGIFSTGAAYAMWNFGVRQIGAAQATAFQNLVPLVALLASWFFLAERPLIVQLLGGSMIIGGLLTMRFRAPNNALAK